MHDIFAFYHKPSRTTHKVILATYARLFIAGYHGNSLMKDFPYQVSMAIQSQMTFHTWLPWLLTIERISILVYTTLPQEVLL